MTGPWRLDIGDRVGATYRDPPTLQPWIHEPHRGAIVGFTAYGPVVRWDFGQTYRENLEALYRVEDAK